jgi:hypothetical protein
VITTRIFQAVCTSLLIVADLAVQAVGTEDSNNCRSSPGDYCERSGSCSIQGSDWYQYVTIDKSDIFDKQGWPGLCDMVHVSLVQGNCSPPGSRVDVTAYLSDTTSAGIPDITGVLACNAPIVHDGDLALRTAGSVQVAHGDMNLDGVIDLADLLHIQKAALQ